MLFDQMTKVLTKTLNTIHEDLDESKIVGPREGSRPTPTGSGPIAESL